MAAESANPLVPESVNSLAAESVNPWVPESENPLAAGLENPWVPALVSRSVAASARTGLRSL